MNRPMSRDDFMRRAITLAHEKMAAGEGGPFGAVVVKDGEIIAEGHNQVTSANDPTAHAEVNAIRTACAKLGTFNLQGCEIFSSCEPCPMCLSAIYWARLDRVFFANTRADAARIGFDDDHIYREVALPLAERAIPMEQLLGEEGRVTFDAWLANPDKIQY